MDIFVDELCFCFHLNWVSSMCEETNLKANWMLWSVFPSISSLSWTFTCDSITLGWLRSPNKVVKRRFFYVCINLNLLRRHLLWCSVPALKKLLVTAISSLHSNSCLDTFLLPDNSYCLLRNRIGNWINY